MNDAKTEAPTKSTAAVEQQEQAPSLETKLRDMVKFLSTLKNEQLIKALGVIAQDAKTANIDLSQLPDRDFYSSLLTEIQKRRESFTPQQYEILNMYVDAININLNLELSQSLTRFEQLTEPIQHEQAAAVDQLEVPISEQEFKESDLTPEEKEQIFNNNLEKVELGITQININIQQAETSMASYFNTINNLPYNFRQTDELLEYGNAIRNGINNLNSKIIAINSRLSGIGAFEFANKADALNDVVKELKALEQMQLSVFDNAENLFDSITADPANNELQEGADIRQIVLNIRLTTYDVKQRIESINYELNRFADLEETPA